MILLTSLNGQKTFYVNADLIEIVEENPDTTITFDSGHKLLVAERSDKVVEMIHKAKVDVFSRFLTN